MHDKVLSLCVPRLKSRAKETRLIMEVDNFKSGTILAVLGLLEKADREDIYSYNMSYYVNKCLSNLFIAYLSLLT